MKAIALSLFFAAVGLLGCKMSEHEVKTDILLSIAAPNLSKTDALTAGDEVAVFARLDGTEDYFLEAAKYVLGLDGQSLTYGSTVYYPETKQAVNFYAYFPYHTGVFSVPSDQSTAVALKQADLCWATAKSTPVSTPISLTFEHKMARLIVQTNEPTSKIACQVVPSGVLNAATGQFTLNNTKSEISTTKNELILPVQPLSRLVLTVSGVEYSYDGSIALQPGQTTTLNLTLSAKTKTATLNGSSTTQWTTTLTTGATTQPVLNTLKLHWPNVAAQASTVNKMVLTIQDLTGQTTADYTVQGGITYANGLFTLPFSSSVLHYPYLITRIRSYAGTAEVLPIVNVFSGSTVYKSGVQTVGVLRNPINPPAPSDYVKIGSLYWTKGNLVATSSTASNMNGCKVGAPGDGGLYFQFGSLIGYKGGNQANGGTGVGIPQAPLTTDGTFWGGAGYSWESDAMVWPTELVGTKATWTNSVGGNIATLTDYYFNYSVAPWETANQNIRDFSVLPGTGVGNLGTGRYAAQGVGDPCTYYLGGTWRLPTTNEYVALCNNQREGWLPWATVGGSWTNIPTFGGNFSSNRLFFPASGLRRNSNGSFDYVTTAGYGWGSSVYIATLGLALAFNSGWVYPQNGNNRSYGFPVRCVGSVP